MGWIGFIGGLPSVRPFSHAMTATTNAASIPQERPGPQPIQIASLQPGDRVDGLLACARKRLINAQPRETTALFVVLRDCEQRIQGHAFAHVLTLADQFSEGQVVHVKGRVVTHNRHREIRLEHIARHVGPPVTAFLPVARRDLGELDGFLEHLAREVSHPAYATLLESLLGDAELRRAWRTAPCSTGGHHAYLGGLLEHTVAVASLAVDLMAVHTRLNQDLLLTAALVHDLGHTRAFTYAADILESEAGRLLGHIELGLEILRPRVRSAGLSGAEWQPLAHCVLTHHGCEPPRRFGCAEAVALAGLVALDESVKRAFELARV